MAARVRLGMLTPSSNTVLEPVTCAMLSSLPHVSAHFSRFPVTEIALDARALNQFDDSPMLHAAELLAHAKVDVICWNGTSSGWLGFDADRRLCERITSATGIRSATAVLTLVDVFCRTGVTSFGLVTPYTDDVQQKIVATFRAEGFDCTAERHLRVRDNYSFSAVTAAQLDDMVHAVAGAGPQAITTFCTNLAAAPLADAWERKLNIPVYDTIATAVFGSLIAAGADAPRISGWGRLFATAASRDDSCTRMR